MRKHHCTSSLAALIAVGAVLGRAQAFAEEEVTPQVGGIEKITVTARKTEEDLQKTPVAVTALTGEDLKDRGINRVIDLSATAPNVIFKSLGGYANGTTVSIRGLGANPDGRPFVDPGVSIYVDGVVQPRPSHNLLDLVDIDRVEVLRGPQGTLFGRNTVGGAVNIITRLPSEEFGLEQKVSFGTYRDIESRSTINTGHLRFEFHRQAHLRPSSERRVSAQHAGAPGRAVRRLFKFRQRALGGPWRSIDRFDGRFEGLLHGAARYAARVGDCCLGPQQLFDLFLGLAEVGWQAGDGVWPRLCRYDQ